MADLETEFRKVAQDVQNKDWLRGRMGLTDIGLERWNKAVLPALGVAFARVQRASPLLPYFQRLPRHLRVRVAEDAYDLGVGQNVAPYGAGASGEHPVFFLIQNISDAFLCERRERGIEGAPGETLSAGVMRLQRSGTIATHYARLQRLIPPGAEESYGAGLCAGAMAVILLGLNKKSVVPFRSSEPEPPQPGR